MEKTAYFERVNRLNAFVNFLAGHFLPLSDNPKKIGCLSGLWMIFAWAVKLVYLISTALGTLHFAKLTADEAFKTIGAEAVLTSEILIPLLYLNFRRSDLHKLIKKYNLILIDCDELREFVRQTVDHYNTGLSIYFIAGLIVSVFFPLAPIFHIFESEQFSYADFTLPAYLPGEPFSRGVFAAGVAMQIVGSCGIHVGTVAMYLYVVHYIAVLVGQYKYVRVRIAEALSEEHGRRDDSSAIAALRDCIEHHSAVIKVGQALGEVLALHVGVTYITCIMEFCFLAYGIITFGSAVVEKFTYIAYTLFRVLLVFMLCSSIQELVDASTSVTDDVFHENWYTRSKTVQKTFYIIQLSNQIECRISAYRIVELVVPTLALILSKSYSVCLLLLSVK
ncbi:odorant receptor 67a-like isoform X2 [Venturia canescens]|uniref:odorant receptor 67a-like isoform X2 n=1 Tax=Venturia canescens TaxID=32260 RepID=UPI001C9CCA8C|nr:odorant receptor 67a-like isoform X2 [Venturia canescens]